MKNPMNDTNGFNYDKAKVLNVIGRKREEEFKGSADGDEQEESEESETERYVNYMFDLRELNGIL